MLESFLLAIQHLFGAQDKADDNAGGCCVIGREETRWYAATTTTSSTSVTATSTTTTSSCLGKETKRCICYCYKPSKMHPPSLPSQDVSQLTALMTPQVSGAVIHEQPRCSP